MAMLLSQARRLLHTSVVHAGASSFDTDKLDAAIRAAGQRFLRETGASRTTTTVAITSGDQTLDLTATITEFIPDWFIRARIGVKPVKLSDPDAVLREFEDATPTGQPNTLAFNAPNDTLIAPRADANYSLLVTHKQDLVTWTPGTQGTYATGTGYIRGDVVIGNGTPDTLVYRCIAATTGNAPPNATYWVLTPYTTAADPDTVSLNIPDEYVSDLIWLGGLFYLVGNAQPHIEGPSVEDKFNRFIATAIERFTGTRSGVTTDQNVKT